MNKSPASPASLGPDSATAALRALGAKLTTPRRVVLHVLQVAPAPLTHRQVLDAASGMACADRVTVYRVLDWLVNAGLAHKAADSDGVFRFSADRAPGTHDRHVHFRCTGCGSVFCLKDAPPQAPRLPKGFRLASFSLDISGQCAQCAGGLQ
jgi:Fur family ferric uptake transcriptional regulator